MILKGQKYVIGWQPKSGGGAEQVFRKAKHDIKGTLQPTFIGSLLRDYFFVDERPLGEKNPKWLQDDYVKFLRFAQWKIEQARRGVVGMITNHSYLDNPTFRGMRQSLMKTFDEIYILDLHGNTLKKETCPDGSKDENVFDIRQGVAIAFFLKRGRKEKNDAILRHADIWGARQTKYAWLDAHDVQRTNWRELKPGSPSYLFVPRDNALGVEYQRFQSILDVFPVNSVGIVTARDRLTIHWSPEDVWKTVTVFLQSDPELARQGYNLGRDAEDWKVTLAQKDLVDSGPTRSNVVPIFYRPFDVRYTYYTGRSRGFICGPRPEVMRHMLAGENKGISVGRAGQVIGPEHWDIVFCTDHITEFNLFRRGGNNLFPLYLYPSELFAHHAPQERQPNLHPKLLVALTRAYGTLPSPEDILHYVYAVLYAPAYREKYADFLRMDFPRVPFTADASLFSEIAALGARLSALHLLKSFELDPPVCRFDGLGNGRIAKGNKTGLRYELGEQRVYINATQWFAPVAEAVWTYHVGGYKVCEKWLKDRQERQLDVNDIRTYCRIVTAIKLTLGIQQEINTLYPRVESNTLVLPECTDASEANRLRRSKRLLK